VFDCSISYYFCLVQIGAEEFGAFLRLVFPGASSYTFVVLTACALPIMFVTVKTLIAHK